MQLPASAVDFQHCCTFLLSTTALSPDVLSGGICELAAELTEAIVAPPLSYGPGVDAVGPPSMGSLELGYQEYLAHAQAVLRGLVKMGFSNIFA